MEGEGDVVVLPCGHPYLLDGNDDSASAVICSVCNTRYTEETASDVDTLPDLDLQETQLCPVHGDPLRMWCRDCIEPACGLCVFDKHQMPTHMVQPANLYVSDTKSDLLAHLDKLHRRTRRGIARNKKAFHACEMQLLKLFRDDKELLQLDGSLRKIKHLVESATAVRTLSHARKDLGWIQTKVWNSPMIRDDDDEEPDDQDASAMAQRRVEDLDTAVESLGVQVSLDNGRRAKLEWNEDSLLVCTTSEASAQPKPVLQLLAVESLGSAPFPEVFLELSVGTVPIGIVYIKLWGHLRRAQNFMLLCMGSLGPSFVGSHLLSVNGRGTTGESIGAGMYKNGMGVMSAVPLLTGLEYGGMYQTEVSRGLLVASSGGNPALDSLYSIIIGDGAGGGYSQCKFGWVVSGLDYLREAAYHQPLEQVWVSQCGLVLPRHT